MKVVFSKWGTKSQVMELEDALRPDASEHGQGELEDLRAQVNLLRNITGNLLAQMVEHKILSLDRASEISGNYRSIEPA